MYDIIFDYCLCTEFELYWVSVYLSLVPNESRLNKYLSIYRVLALSRGGHGLMVIVVERYQSLNSE